ncbi:MAG TPA: hypothetical protein VGG45_10455 [Terracidiphilus sp.]|jgi:hypothetical protein
MKILLWIPLLLANIAFGQTSIPTLTAEQWRQDLGDFVKEVTTKHANPYHLTSKAQFDQAVSELRERIPSMKNYEVVVGLQHLAALIGDGHTFIDTGSLYRKFPLEVFWFGSDLRVIRASPEYQQALNTKIIAIDSLPIQEVQSRLQQLIPQGENQWYVLNSSQKLLIEVEPLAALGVLPNLGPAKFTFEDDTGHQFTLQIRPVAAGASHAKEVDKNPAPLPLQHPEDPLWFKYLAESKTVYVDWRSYQDLKTQSERLFACIKGNPVDRLIVDMRWNEGGNFTKARQYLIEKIMYMPQLNRAGHLYVITGRATFSAAMTNVTDFRRETQAILVGEPTGARPNGYMENYLFTLPLSKLRGSCAMLKYRFQPDANTDTVFPDKRIDPDWRLFSEGQDAALRWILAQPLEAVNSQ